MVSTRERYNTLRRERIRFRRPGHRSERAPGVMGGRSPAEVRASAQRRRTQRVKAPARIALPPGERLTLDEIAD